MDIVIDTSALIAVIVGEPEKEKIVKATQGCSLIAPGAVPWEIGNAFSAMFKRDRLSLCEAEKGLSLFERIPIRYLEPNLAKVLYLSQKTQMYAYDVYFLDCAIRHKSPLLTLDKKLKIVAQSLNIEVLEV